MGERADVCIIGGGIVGVSLAYHLARSSRLEILLLEQGQLGHGSTSRSAGGIRRQFLTEIEIRPSIESLKMFQDSPLLPRRFREGALSVEPLTMHGIVGGGL